MQVLFHPGNINPIPEEEEQKVTPYQFFFCNFSKYRS